MLLRLNINHYSGCHKYILIMDNASWHKRKRTHWHNWQPIDLKQIIPATAGHFTVLL
jgi:hypothetical protein